MAFASDVPSHVADGSRCHCGVIEFEGWTLGFLIKVTFWLGLVLLFIPYGDGKGEQANSVGPLQVLHTTAEVARDFSGICERRPDTCQSGKAILKAIGARAREGARIAYNALDSKLADDNTELHTGSVTKPEN